MPKLLIALVVVLLPLSSRVLAIELGSVAISRFSLGARTLDDRDMTRTRTKLLEPANFGPGGTVSEPINITDIDGPIDFITLSNFDIFFVGPYSYWNWNQFTADELQAMQDWVTVGGTMIVACDPIVNIVCEAFGPILSVDSQPASPPVRPTQTGSTRPPFDGPFGKSYTLNAIFPLKFDNIGEFLALAEDKDGSPMVLESLLGEGRIVLLSDVSMISNQTLSEGSGISNDNDRFLANLVAYLANSAKETFVMNPGINGNWWGGPSRNGEGAQIELMNSGENYLLVLTFYSYDNLGNQIFLIATGIADGNSAELTAYVTEGGLWGADFDPVLVNEKEFGAGSISFSHCGLARMVLIPNAQFQVEGFSRIEYDLSRLGDPALPCPISNF